MKKNVWAISGENCPSSPSATSPGPRATAQEHLRILVFMLHPGYLRNFESTLRELAARGHQIHIGFDRLKGKLEGQLSLLDDLVANTGLTSDFVPRAPRRRSWTFFGRQSRYVIDWLRYLDPPFEHAEKLRQRLEIGIPRSLRLLVRLPFFRSSTGRRLLRRALVAVDRSIPPRNELVQYVRQHAPDMILLTPLLDMNEIQSEYLRAARRMGISSGYLVASWDNLTSKGVIHDVPDFTTVWNDAQKREAIELHGIPPDRVIVTGAGAYDHWFDWQPATTREEFCARIGLRSDRPFLLYVGSSTFIAPHEGPGIERWVDQIRDLGLADVGVLVRPHPTNPLYAANGPKLAPGSLYRRTDVAVWPQEGTNPTDQASRNDYYDSIHHAAAVVGVNTSALIESAIIGREVLTLLEADYAQTQQGTLHFEHIANNESGVLTVASSIEEHVAQLSRLLDNYAITTDRVHRFVETFVRPFGATEPATPRMIDAIESARLRTPRLADRDPIYSFLIRAVIFAYDLVHRALVRSGAPRWINNRLNQAAK